MRLRVDQVEVNLTAGYAIKEGERLNIRPKTLQVLQYLINEQHQVVSKSTLLNNIWQGVVVQEQVLVQSIKEIRAIFGSDCIKTYPKQGYQWVAETEKVKKIQPYFIALAVLSFCLFSLFIFTNNFEQQPSSNQSQYLQVAFLPIENKIPDAAHQWLPTLGTENLRDLMAQHQQITVISADKLEQIRQQKNVDVIVSTKLMGYPNDFQLDYTLYLPHGSERGVEFANTINGVFEKLVTTLGQRFDISAKSSLNNFPQSDFSEEALTRGIALFLNREYQAASGFFQAALVDNEHLLVARRFLAACHINIAQTEQGRDLLLDNIKQAQTLNDFKEQTRSQLMLGALLINWPDGGQLADATKHLYEMIEQAEQHNQAIFAAYGYEELAKIYRLQADYAQANIALNKALKLHQQVTDNYSQTTALIELALVAAAQNKLSIADNYFNQAHKVANQHGATTNQVVILLAQAKAQKQQGNTQLAREFANQALVIAKQANNQLLIARIKAWQENRYYYEVH